MSASKLRRPYGHEADYCVKLIYISGPDLYTYIFVEREPKVYDLIKLLFNTPGTMCAKENAVIEEENGRIRGILISYPARDMNKMAISMLTTIKGMLMISGLLNFIIILFRLKLNRYFPKTGNDEFFISNLAVFEECRGKGIAVRLLEKAEEMAAEKGLNKLSLYVETDNTNAKRVYKNFGFQEVKKVLLPEKYNRHNLFGFSKMTKVIGEN